MTTLEYGHPEVERILARAHELCQRVQNPAQLARALGNLSFARYGRGELVPALEVAEQMVALGKETGDDAVLFLGLIHRGMMLMTLGLQPAEAARCSAQAHALVTPGLEQTMLRIWGRSAYGTRWIGRMWLAWLQGYPDRVREEERLLAEYTVLAKSPHELAYAMARWWPALFLREPARLLELAPKAIEWAERYGYREWLAWGQLFLGVAHCIRDRPDEGLLLIRAANTARRGLNTVFHYSLHAALEAEQYRRFGLYADAQEALDRGFAHVEQTDERFMEAELHRVQGELFLIAGESRVAEAEACFGKALEVSRAQDSRSLKLRAATSLARLLLRQGRGAEASEVLKPVYEGFTEGFDTPDLRDAAELLALGPD